MVDGEEKQRRNLCDIMKKIITFTLAVFMLVSMMAIQAMAMSDLAYSRAKTTIAVFPEVSYLVSGRTGTVLALQAYLMRFNDTCSPICCRHPTCSIPTNPVRSQEDCHAKGMSCFIGLGKITRIA